MKTYDECYFLNYDNYDDILLFEVGCQKCLPHYDFGPIIRENFVLHYIIAGCGTLYLSEKAFPVSAGEAFITPPNVLTYYQADAEHPWNYMWLHFNGKKVIEFIRMLGITDTSPIFRSKYSSQKIEACITEILRNHEKELFCIGSMYCLFQQMQEQTELAAEKKDYDSQLLYIRKAIEFIQRKYFEPIRITNIANYCGLNRSYLTKIFKEATGYSPQEYLINYRIIKAKNLLRKHDIPVSYVAHSVGYTDPLAFSKLFKHKVGIAPCDYYEEYLAHKDEVQI
ncbi:MAG TPA: AraC family transcriptional regulator [Lachnospiraceae bacterium]|nr:AraC family transcriptional regulator [Lachnospiraceae bacterium]